MKFTMIERLSIYFLLFLTLILPDAYSQNSTSSPFSIFGIGEIETRDFGRTAGIGDAGIGFQSQNHLNRRNPAALSGIDTLRFIIDVSAAMKISQFVTSSHNSRTNNFNFKSMAAGVRLTKRWTSSAGLVPYSSVGYSIEDRQHGKNTLDAYKVTMFSGSGGVNKFYWANAFELFRGFSMGITSSYLFGSIVHNEETETFYIKETNNISKIYFDFGMQYSHWFGEHTRVTVGGIYKYNSKFDIQRTLTVTSNIALEDNKRKPDLKSYLPETIGAGFSIVHNKRSAEWIFAADYQFQNYSTKSIIKEFFATDSLNKLKYQADKPLRHKNLTYTDNHIYNVGIQFTPNTKRPENYFQIMRFQLGACYNRSYLKVSGYQVEDLSFSLGVGLPFNNSSYVNIAANFGESRTGERGGITERYVLLSVNFSLIDRWFAKYQWN